MAIPPPGTTLPPVAEHLLDPSREGVELVQTHVSSLIFDGELVHKRKKPVRFAFVDLSTPERRERVCRQEVELNRRFSPDVYLGVEEIVDDEGRVVDHAVLMRRMPADRRLATLVQRHREVAGCLRSVARIMAECHAGSTTSEEIASVATARGVAGPVGSEPPRDRIASSPTRSIRRSSPGSAGSPAAISTDATRLLEERIARGRIVDGHGDLLADDIFCLDDGPRILDGLEFDERLRWGDVV